MPGYASAPLDLQNMLGWHPLVAVEPIGDGALRAQSDQLRKVRLAARGIDGALQGLKVRHAVCIPPRVIYVQHSK